MRSNQHTNLQGIVLCPESIPALHAHVENHDEPVLRTRTQEVSVLVPAHLEYASGGLEGAQQLAVPHRPDVHPLVEGARRQVLAVGAECKAVDGLGVALQLPYALPPLHLPQPTRKRRWSENLRKVYGKAALMSKAYFVVGPEKLNSADDDEFYSL